MEQNTAQCGVKLLNNTLLGLESYLPVKKLLGSKWELLILLKCTDLEHKDCMATRLNQNHFYLELLIQHYGELMKILNLVQNKMKKQEQCCILLSTVKNLLKIMVNKN